MIDSSSTKQQERILVHISAKIKDLIPGFLANRHHEVNRIIEALGQEDFDTIRVIGHGTKGCGGGYGFHGITDIGRSLEQAAQHSDVEAIQRGVDELSTYLERVDVVFIQK